MPRKGTACSVGWSPRSSWACHCSGNQERPASGRGGDPVRKTLAVTSGCFWRWPRRRRRQIPTDLTLFRERRPPSAPPAETGDNDRPRPPDQPGGQGAVCGCYLRRDLPGARARRPALRSAFTHRQVQLDPAGDRIQTTSPATSSKTACAGGSRGAGSKAGSTASWYIRPTIHRLNFQPMDGRGRSSLQPPNVSDYPPAWSTLTPPFTPWPWFPQMNGSQRPGRGRRRSGVRKAGKVSPNMMDIVGINRWRRPRGTSSWSAATYLAGEAVGVAHAP